MIPIAEFAFFILKGLLTIVFWAILISAIMSWLVAFNVVNPRNRMVWQVIRALEALSAPALTPLRKIIPTLGGIDITPVIALMVIAGVRDILLRGFEQWTYAQLLGS